MKNHVKIYMRHFGYGEQDFIPCECCQKKAVDIHHIKYKSRGGGDTIDNLMALCRKHHEQAHAEKIIESDLLLIHRYFMTGERRIFKE